ncbi:hypothetical protein [Lentibacillus saliphilus]|uniref:hypothetical protein n=1 Tax=Lentibacillus saliphilus TaxID=2737028 RepID=UPI001C2F2524|nr:hypothetical protein [Lentibacillus saliphilus]
MSVKITGLNKLLSELETKLGKQAMQRISDIALIDAANEFVKVLKIGFEAAGDKGYAEGHTVDEITVTGPFWDTRGVRTMKVHWVGPHERYRIIHLNEWGGINNPNPPRKGVIARAMKNSEKAYRDAVRKALKGGL